MNIVKQHWNEIITKLKNEYGISSVGMKTWIHPLEVTDIVGDTVYISVEHSGSVEIIKNKYLLALQVCIAEVVGQEFDITFVVSGDIAEEQEDIIIPTKTNSQLKTLIDEANLNPQFTFDTFVVGSNNQFAQGASQAVSEAPGEIYNPLFLYGGVGLGKTHLMHSIAINILKNDPSKKILYVTSESFTNELIDSLKSGKRGNMSAMQVFREKYRNIDVLLIDDIQFIIGKESTQEEFFHTFNQLHLSGKQIIISSDKPPKDMVALEARLLSRFESGLSADISAPNYETRMAILRKKAESNKLKTGEIPDDVLNYIAENITSNIRELQGSLNNLVLFSKLEQKPIDIELAANALKDIIQPLEKREITVDLIIQIVAEHFNITIEDIRSPKRTKELVFPRQIIMYLASTMTDSTLKAIATSLKRSDHSTVHHGRDKIAKDILVDEKLSTTIETIKKKINPL